MLDAHQVTEQVFIESLARYYSRGGNIMMSKSCSSQLFNDSKII